MQIPMQFDRLFQTVLSGSSLTGNENMENVSSFTAETINLFFSLDFTNPGRASKLSNLYLANKLY